jgi:uncharacterized protein (UPF0333 family)
MRFIEEKRAQASMEVLLLIAGAIVVVTVVGIVVKNMVIVAAERASDVNALPP